MVREYLNVPANNREQAIKTVRKVAKNTGRTATKIKARKIKGRGIFMLAGRNQYSVSFVAKKRGRR